MVKATVGDISLHYVDQGSGRLLLLVHGFPLDHSMWSSQIDAFSRNYRVVAPDLRGFGRSGVTPGKVTMEKFADDMAALLDTLAIREPVVFCGLSMGGYIAFQFWKRHAQRLAALVLCDTRAIADTPEAARGRLATSEQVLSQGLTGLADTMVPKLFAEESRRTQPALVEATRQVMLNAPPAGVAAALHGMAARPDVSGELMQIRVPTLLICGEHDVISTPTEMRGIAQAIPNAKYLEITHAGHMAPLERPRPVNAELEQFLRAVS